MITIIVPTLAPTKAHKTAKYAQDCAGKGVILHVVHDNRGDGFTRTVNRGLRAAKTSYICLLNDDCEPMTDGWLHRLHKGMQVDPRIGFIGPSGPCRTPPQNKGVPGSPYGIIPVSHVAFFCVLMRREVFEEIGFLDEAYRHYGSDIDVQFRAKKQAGWLSAWARHVYMWHELHDTNRWWKADNETFQKRWGTEHQLESQRS